MYADDDDFFFPSENLHGEQPAVHHNWSKTTFALLVLLRAHQS